MSPLITQGSKCLLIVCLSTLLSACGGTPPPPARGVLETAVGDWSFRRYQQVQEVEVYVAENPAVAHTASYLRTKAEKAGRIGDEDLVNAFVTRYRADSGVVRASIVFARRLAQAGYKVEEEKRAGVRVFTIVGHDEKWVLWPASKHVIKLGGRYVSGVPKQLVKAYGHRYPSQLRAGMLDGPLPPDPSEQPKDGEGEPYDPDNPTPDWDKFKKNKDEVKGKVENRGTSNGGKSDR